MKKNNKYILTIQLKILKLNFPIVFRSIGSAVGLVADSDAINIVLESSTWTVRIQSPTQPAKFLYSLLAQGED